MSVYNLPALYRLEIDDRLARASLPGAGGHHLIINAHSSPELATNAPIGPGPRRLARAIVLPAQIQRLGFALDSAPRRPRRRSGFGGTFRPPYRRLDMWDRRRGDRDGSIVVCLVGRRRAGAKAGDGGEHDGDASHGRQYIIAAMRAQRLRTVCYGRKADIRNLRTTSTAFN